MIHTLQIQTHTTYGFVVKAIARNGHLLLVLLHIVYCYLLDFVPKGFHDYGSQFTIISSFIIFYAI